MKVRSMIVAAAMTLLLPIFAWGQTVATDLDISKMELNLSPPGFETMRTGKGSSGRWLVVPDETASHGRAIAQIDTDRTDYRFPLAIYQPITAKNVEVSVRFKAVAGTVDRAGGIAVRLLTPDQYYVVRANALEDNVRLYRVVNGNRQQIAGADTKVTSNEWHTLTLRAEDDRFTVSFDGKPLFTATDRTFANAGKIALWTKADSVTHFDSVAIQPLP